MIEAILITVACFSILAVVVRVAYLIDRREWIPKRRLKTWRG